jgi:hypothetical protein
VHGLTLPHREGTHLMRIQLAVPWTDDKNVDHRAGTKLNVTPDVAHQLIKDGFAAAVGVG